MKTLFRAQTRKGVPMEKKHESNIDRRSFLKCAALTGGTAALAGLAACSPAPSGTSETKPSGGSGQTATATSKYVWETPPAPITDVKETKEFDVVIVGAGIAGISAAEAAARNGAKVAVLEQMAEYSLRGVDNGSLNNSWKGDGISIPEDTAARPSVSRRSRPTNYNLINTWATRSVAYSIICVALTSKYGVNMGQHCYLPPSRMG